MTPCEKLGYKVGDEFEVVESTHFYYRKGDTATLAIDDGTHNPIFLSRSGKPIIAITLDLVRPLPITLRKGDYCSTANMTESEYHAVAAAFMASGADEGEYPNWGWASDQSILPNFGWYEEGLYHGNDEFEGRNLTPAQIIGAVNAKPK